jgi:hypothetical protein
MYLFVSIKGTKTWKFDYRLDARPVPTLSGASQTYRFMNTLWPVCEKWLNDNRAKWTAYYYGQARRFLTRYVKGSPLGTMPVRDIKVAHVYDLMQSIAKRKTLAGDERKGRLEIDSALFELKRSRKAINLIMSNLVVGEL